MIHWSPRVLRLAAVYEGRGMSKPDALAKAIEQCSRGPVTWERKPSRLKRHT